MYCFVPQPRFSPTHSLCHSLRKDFETQPPPFTLPPPCTPPPPPPPPASDLRPPRPCATHPAPHGPLCRRLGPARVGAPPTLAHALASPDRHRLASRPPPSCQSPAQLPCPAPSSHRCPGPSATRSTPNLSSSSAPALAALAGYPHHWGGDFFSFLNFTSNVSKLWWNLFMLEWNWLNLDAIW
jgi:hypothetical protein